MGSDRISTAGNVGCDFGGGVMTDAREVVAKALCDIEKMPFDFPLQAAAFIRIVNAAGFVIVPAEQTNPFLVNAPTPGIAQALGNPD